MPRPQPRFKPERDYSSPGNGTWIIWDSIVGRLIYNENYEFLVPVRFFTRADARIGVQIIKEKADAMAAAATQ